MAVMTSSVCVQLGSQDVKGRRSSIRGREDSHILRYEDSRSDLIVNDPLDHIGKGTRPKGNDIVLPLMSTPVSRYSRRRRVKGDSEARRYLLIVGDRRG